MDSNVTRRASYHGITGTRPAQFSGLRSQGLHLWDISAIKHFQFGERFRLQLRSEFLNAFNHPQFNDPEGNPTNCNFGRSTSQQNLPRSIQFGLRLVFCVLRYA